MDKTESERTYKKPMQVRVTPEQYVLFQRAAERDGRTLSNWARDRLLKVAQRELGKSSKP